MTAYGLPRERLLLSAAIALCLGCAAHAPTPVPDAKPDQPVAPLPDSVDKSSSATIPARGPSEPGLRFTVEPGDASIAVDGVAVGKVSDLAASGGFLRVKPGLHQVSLKREGYVTWRAEVGVHEAPEPIEVSMVKRN